MAERPSPPTQDTIVAMCEDGRRRSSVFLIGQFLNVRLARVMMYLRPSMEFRRVTGPALDIIKLT